MTTLYTHSTDRPSLEYEEELVDYRRGSSIGVELTGPSYKHRPGHTSKVTYCIRIHPTSFCVGRVGGRGGGEIKRIS